MSDSTDLKILYFGIYSKEIEYPRNNNLIRGLRSHGVNVFEAHCKLAGSFQQRMQVVKNPLKAVLFFLRLAASFVILTWKFFMSPRVDAVIVGHPGYFHIHLCRLLCRLFRKDTILIYDVFIPLYDAIVEDRKLIKPNGIFARILHLFERSCCRQEDICLTDTNEHRKYLIEEFSLDSERVHRIFVGPTINAEFKCPAVRARNDFKALYVGTYIPLHGVEVILMAARRLINEKKIRFTLVGSGQMRAEMERLTQQWLLTNITFLDWIPTNMLGEFIRSHDFSLGIFGATSKAARVIPSKVYDICAAGVPFITADTPAIREVFRTGENAYLVPPNDPVTLAEAVIELKSNYILRKRIAEKAYQIGQEEFSLARISDDLIKIIRDKSQGASENRAS